MSMRKNIDSIDRVLIVGLGSIGQRHLRIARSLLPNADIKILRHQFNDQAEDPLSNGTLYLIEDAVQFAPQIAIISSPAAFHLSSAQALAEVGVHLFIEKPLASSLHDVDKLLEICLRRQNILMIGYNLRFLPSLQYFRRALIDGGVVGKVLLVNCEAGQYLPSWRPNSDYRKSVSANRELGGGVLLELSHELDYLRWIFGEVEWVKATLSRQSSLVLDVEDSASLTLGFSPDSDGWGLIGSVNLDFIRQDTSRRCIAIGEHGSLQWNGLTGEVSLYQAGAKQWKKIFSHSHHPDNSYISEWEHFLDCVKTNRAPLITGVDGLKVLQIIDAARHAASSRYQILVPK